MASVALATPAIGFGEGDRDMSPDSSVPQETDFQPGVRPAPAGGVPQTTDFVPPADREVANAAPEGDVVPFPNPPDEAPSGAQVQPDRGVKGVAPQPE